MNTAGPPVGCGNGYRQRRIVWSSPPPPPQSLHIPRAGTHRQSMVAPYILVTQHKAHTQRKQSTQIVNTFKCVVGGPQDFWNRCHTNYRLMCPHMWFISTY